MVSCRWVGVSRINGEPFRGSVHWRAGARSGDVECDGGGRFAIDGIPAGPGEVEASTQGLRDPVAVALEGRVAQVDDRALPADRNGEDQRWWKRLRRRPR